MGKDAQDIQPAWQSRNGIRLFQGDVEAVLAGLPADHYHCCVTSPPYWALRSYLAADDPLKEFELGSEATPEKYIENMVRVFSAVRRVLHPTGTLWLNVGDSYSSGGHGGHAQGGGTFHGHSPRIGDRHPRKAPPGFKPGEPCNIPHRLGEALRADGWWWRSTIIWRKPSCMPESVSGWKWVRCRVKVKASGRVHGQAAGDGYFGTADGGSRPGGGGGNGLATTTRGRAQWRDCPGCAKCTPNGGYVLRRGRWRPTASHEYILLMAKSERYFCDAEAVKEPAAGSGGRQRSPAGWDTGDGAHGRVHRQGREPTVTHNELAATRNPRSVQSFAPEPSKYAHYAAFPSALPLFALKAGTSSKGCCPECGVPWSPVVEEPYRGGKRIDGSTGLDSSTRNAMGGGVEWAAYEGSRVTGYRPSCECRTDDPAFRDTEDWDPIPPHPVPCRAIDPFSGTATTLLATAQLALHADGIELNPEYLKMAIERLQGILVPRGQADAAEATGPLFSEVAT